MNRKGRDKREEEEGGQMIYTDPVSQVFRIEQLAPRLGLELIDAV